MSREIVASALVGLAIAGAVGFLVARWVDPGHPAPTAISTTTTTIEPPPAHFSSPHETVLGPVAVVATDLQFDGEEVALEFEVASLAPVGDAASVTRVLGFGAIEEVPASELETVYLDRWTLITSSGEIPGTVATPEARTARFDVGSGFSLESVTGARLESYGLLVPVDTDFALEVGREVASVAPGVTARLLAVTEQATTIIQVELISERDFNSDTVAIAGVGPGWKSAVREAEGRPRWNLTYDRPQAPSPIPLRLHGAVWMTIESEAEILLDGIQ
jgi:hypothetical protein